MDKNKETYDLTARSFQQEEGAKPQPLYDKTDRNFQEADQSERTGNINEAADDERRGSSSAEEKDITV
jgi:hypothetical protein